ncbi:MAG: hypothetical protein AB7R69_00705 [Candidatus Babeliales bacterium]
MNKSNLISLLVLITVINAQGATITKFTKQQPKVSQIATKAGEVEEQFSEAEMEAQNLVIPFDQKRSMFHTQKHIPVMNDLNATVAALKTRNHNIVHSAAPMTGMTMIASFKGPKGTEFLYEKVGKETYIGANNQPVYMHNMYKAFNDFAEKHADIGIVCASGIDMKQIGEPLVEFKNPNFRKGMPGSGEWCYVFFKNINVTPAHLETLKAKMQSMMQTEEQ